MKKILGLILALSLASCAKLNYIVNNFILTQSVLTDLDISNGIKAALEKGVSGQVSKLTVDKGFYNNELVKIVLP